MSKIFLKNAWYMIAWSDDVGANPFERVVMNEPIVVFRKSTKSGDLVALHDRCPHRFAPLSKGVVVDGNIECPYHGLQFNSSGACVKSLFSSAVPAAAKVRSYPVQETAGTIWVWMGDPEQADPAKIPVFRHHDPEKFKLVRGITTAKADYRLLCDNLMDLSHTTTVHPGLGGRAYLPKVKSWEENGDILASFTTDNMQNFFGEDVIPSPLVRHCDTIRWIAPSCHLLESKTGPAGTDEVVVEVISAHILTPETESTTHYFWSSNVPPGFPEEMVYETLVQAFDREDKPMVEAVQVRMAGAELWDLKPVLLPSDIGGVKMRRKLEALLAAEQELTNR